MVIINFDNNKKDTNKSSSKKANNILKPLLEDKILDPKHSLLDKKILIDLTNIKLKKGAHKREAEIRKTNSDQKKFMHGTKKTLMDKLEKRIKYRVNKFTENEKKSDKEKMKVVKNVRKQPKGFTVKKIQFSKTTNFPLPGSNHLNNAIMGIKAAATTAKNKIFGRDTKIPVPERLREGYFSSTKEKAKKELDKKLLIGGGVGGAALLGVGTGALANKEGIKDWASGESALEKEANKILSRFYKGDMNADIFSQEKSDSIAYENIKEQLIDYIDPSGPYADQSNSTKLTVLQNIYESLLGEPHIHGGDMGNKYNIKGNYNYLYPKLIKDDNLREKIGKKMIDSEDNGEFNKAKNIIDFFHKIKGKNLEETPTIEQKEIDLSEEYFSSEAKKIVGMYLNL